jgi:hypothetical protein
MQYHMMDIIQIFGIKTSPMAIQNIKHRCRTVNHDLPFPDDTFHAEFVEYIIIAKTR